MILASLFITGVIIFIVLYQNAPHLTDSERQAIFKFPRGVEDLREDYKIINRYFKDNTAYVYVLFCYLYVLLQSFAIPGPIFLSVLSGALFGGVQGFLMVCLCATFGASSCYMLSYILARGLVIKYFPGHLIRFNEKIHSHRKNIFWYMLFLRITPLIPNWFVNVSSPIVGIPFKHFFFGTLFGLMPANIIHIRTGLALDNISQVGMNITGILSLAALAFLALIPTLFKRKIQKLDEQKKSD